MAQADQREGAAPPHVRIHNHRMQAWAIKKQREDF
jgi:hypothetical protein